ncbi:MAG: hypothetical protein E6Q24_21290 [Chitinophagaceae bacterium]|jgi:steroid 5-alpha reductase family enzyme|nr:MAG: hypothetical protein E6Q24_21290 [Chitinophagaceae bacterium]
MAKKNTGCLTIAVIWAALITYYYLFMFDYKHKAFSWLDSIIAISALIVLIGGVSNLTSKKDKNAE